MHVAVLGRYWVDLDAVKIGNGLPEVNDRMVVDGALSEASVIRKSVSGVVFTTA